MGRMRKLWAGLLVVCMLSNLYGVNVLAAVKEHSAAGENRNGSVAYSEGQLGMGQKVTVPEILGMGQKVTVPKILKIKKKATVPKVLGMRQKVTVSEKLRMMTQRIPETAIPLMAAVMVIIQVRQIKVTRTIQKKKHIFLWRKLQWR